MIGFFLDMDKAADHQIEREHASYRDQFCENTSQKKGRKSVGL